MDIAGLYRGPLEDFVARRTALARELRRTDPDAAAALSKLRKPPAGVWAIDQLSAEDTPVVAELLAAGADAREAQWRVAAGSVNREDLLVASSRLRDAVEAAARAAIALLEHDGHGTSDETARRIRTTLQAAATGGAADRQALWAGTLGGDVDVAGFGVAHEPEDDPDDLAAALAGLRRTTSTEPQSPASERASKTVAGVTRRAAERSATLQVEAARRARDAAVAVRHDADRLAEEAREAAEKASVAEQAADAAEEAARSASAALED